VQRASGGDDAEATLPQQARADEETQWCRAQAVAERLDEGGMLVRTEIERAK
jgi:hypothetical protein